jgi:pimeloyl-ACP methyl ester carboxylesterase
MKTRVTRIICRDMRGAERGKLSPMAAALRQYLQTIDPMPLKITEMSQRCTTTPITREGVFPELLFEEPISLRYAIERGIKLYVVAGEKDEVVDLPSALAMFEIPCINNYSGASCYVIPGAGHVAPMTTCAVKGSKNFIGNVGGPLWYHLKIEAEEMRQKTL